MKCCVLTDVGTWTNWLTFEPDPDAGTGLLSPISYTLRKFAALPRLPASCAAKWNFMSGKIPHIHIGDTLLELAVVLKWFLLIWIIIIIIIIMTMFMVLSSWQSHCESSPGSFDECRMAPSSCRPKTKPDDLGCESACTGCQKLHPPSLFIITQPESWYWYSITHFTIPQRVDGWVDLAG